jgi:hypothetical protein
VADAPKTNKQKNKKPVILHFSNHVSPISSHDRISCAQACEGHPCDCAKELKFDEILAFYAVVLMCTLPVDCDVNVSYCLNIDPKCTQLLCIGVVAFRVQVST